MNINRYNYEEYFLLYVDNELSSAEREAVEVFVQANPDLREELTMLEDAVLRPDRKLVFDDKASLIRSVADANPVNESNYIEYFVLYGDDELTNEEKDWVEQFIYKHPQFQAELELTQQARMTPDTTIVFPDKSSLYRKEEKERPVIVMRWWKIAAAAVVVLMIGGAAIYFSNNTGNNNTIDQNGMASESGKENQSKDDGKRINPTVTEETNTGNQIATNDAQSVTPSAIQNSKGVTKKLPMTEDEYNALERQRAMASNDVPQKKSDDNSNSGQTSNVKPIEDRNTAIAVVEPKRNNTVTESQRANAGDVEVDLDGAFNRLAANDVAARPDNDASFASNSNNEIEVLNTTVSNKGKMRGFFRKLGRVVDKATNLGNSDSEDISSNDKKGVRVASFQIALK